MVREIKNLGIGRIELNFTLTRDFVRDIISMRDAGDIEVTSLHNFCPIPTGITPKKASPDYYSLASLDETERAKALRFTRETILTAQRLKAGTVVLHLGKVKTKDYTKKLADALDTKTEYARLKNEMIKARQAHAKPHLDKAIASLEDLSTFAEEKGVRLGIETRYYHTEIPSVDEIGIILNHFKSKNVGYWHDAGHAQLYENLGICKHKKYLDRYKENIIGMHLHDISGTKDHMAPLQGEFDFSILRPYLTEKTVLVLEPHEVANAEDIKKGAKYLESVLGIKQ